MVDQAAEPMEEWLRARAALVKAIERIDTLRLSHENYPREADNLEPFLELVEAQARALLAFTQYAGARWGALF